MKAVRVEQFGGLEALKVEEVPWLNLVKVKLA